MKRTRKPRIRTDLISSGSTLLNLACSDTPYGAFSKGKFVNIIGDSSAGKTFLALTIAAELCYANKEYRIVYDEPEEANEFNLDYLFGPKFVNHLETNITSETVQDFQRNILAELDKEEPILYILDSFDALTSDQEIKRVEEGKDGYKTEKPKMASEILRMIVSKLNETKTILIIISQTRTNIGATFGSKKTRSGGLALKFYSTHEMWLAVKKKILKQKRMIGVDARVRVSKNKLTGKTRDIDLSLYYDYGLDDIGTNIDFMIEEGDWSKSGKSSIVQDDFDIGGTTKNKLIDWIEENDKEKQLARLVEEVWNKIEESLKLNRKRKYHG